ncbi:TetR/AcrR family transcriptional regulator [Flavobacterium sp. M31R6]|uniref:TetR/AcrR family transcriptional regulator n=1 Tax=Flavobacterium sp. M31R6 TaxID=2739062 RepID=UPI001567F718|nr:TetR/AcrR family transcriptional regulator [Flavobacterium sp. M31R6]QKJ64149.1 TetR/AcrR family transcriptional regulator [Flavobacterium sp. M31R6]
MEKPKKIRVNSEKWVVDNCIKVFNEEGLDLTLNEIAKHLQVSRGKINYYFQTKEELLIAIAKEYEKALVLIQAEHVFNDKDDFIFQMFQLYSKIMDNQYKFRCAIIYTTGTSNSRKDMVRQINSSYKNSKERILVMTQNLVQMGLLKETVLDPPVFDVFNYQFVNLFTTWVIQLEIYDKTEGYDQMKPIYLQGIANCYWIYATEVGRNSIDKIPFNDL